MSEMKFVVNGKEMTALQLKAIAPKAPPKSSDALKTVELRDQAKVSLGFIVLGYSPEHWESRVKARSEALVLHEIDPLKNKAPGTLEEWTPKWMSKNKPKRVRSKPYELLGAAELCGQMAVKAGWLFVRIDEILKG